MFLFDISLDFMRIPKAIHKDLAVWKHLVWLLPHWWRQWAFYLTVYNSEIRFEDVVYTRYVPEALFLHVICYLFYCDVSHPRNLRKNKVWQHAPISPTRLQVDLEIYIQTDTVVYFTPYISTIRCPKKFCYIEQICQANIMRKILNNMIEQLRKCVEGKGST